LRVDADGAKQLAFPALEGEFPQTPFGANWRVDLLPGLGAVLKLASERGSWLEVEAAIQSAAGERAWEVCVPLSALGLRPGQQVKVATALAHDDRIVEAIPADRLHTFTVLEVA
jgi:hypothetical protein